MKKIHLPACLLLVAVPSASVVTPPDFLKSMFYGRVQEMRATDDYLVVHSVDGNTHKVMCLREPEAVFLWEKSYRSMSSPRNIHVSGNRVAVVAAEGDPAKTVGMHVYDAATGAETGYFRDNIFAPIGSHIVSSSGASGEIIDLASSAKVFAYSRDHRIRLKAVIGNRVLYLGGEGADSAPWSPLLLSLPGLTDEWRGKAFSSEIIQFLEKEMDPSEKTIVDGFPVLFAGKPRTRPAGPFPLLFLHADGRGRIMTPAEFNISEPDRSVAVDFSYAWRSGTFPGVVAGLNTGHLRSSGAEEMVIVSVDYNGILRGRTSFSLRNNRVIRSEYTPQGNLVLLLQRFRPKGAILVAGYRLPGLEKAYEKELGFIRATPGPGRLIGDEAFFAAATDRDEETILSVKTADGSLSAFYPFPERPYFLQKTPDDLFGVSNSRHLFVAMDARESDPRHTMVYRIPRGSAGWFEGSLSVPSPVYTNSAVSVSYAPPYGALSVSGGTLDGSIWKTPAAAGPYVVRLAIGNAVRECPVQVLDPPPNVPPVADFAVVDPPESQMWGIEARFDASASRDPDGRIVRYFWSFGDGTVSDGADKVRASHFTVSPGIYDVTLTVVDDRGGFSKKTRRVVLGRILRYQTPSYVEIGIPPALAAENTANYQIQVLTGGDVGADTRAAIYLALYGPKNAEGMRNGSGEFKLDRTTAPLNTVPFKQKALDTFGVAPPGNMPGIQPGGSLDDVEFLTLRHDNAGSDPGWACYGIRVTNQKNGKTWVFVPDQWLDFSREPKRRVWDKFVRVDESYPGGILFKGDDPPGGEGLIKASDNIFILPADMTKFYFTMLDRGRYIGIYRDGAFFGGTTIPGSSALNPDFLRKTEWGVACQASLITRPTKFDLTLGSGNREKKGIVWIFPSGWKDHPDLARKAALALPLKNNLGLFDYGTTARDFLQGVSVNVAAALAPITNYGSQALAIFGDIPDVSLSGYAETAVTEYVNLRLALIAAKLGITFASELTSTINDLLTSIQRALEWGEGMGDAISAGLAATYASALLKNMATGKVGIVNKVRRTSGNGSFLVSVDMLRVLKGKMETLVTAAESNNPASFQDALDTIEGIILGTTAGMTPQQIQGAADSTSFQITYADYGISYFDSEVKKGYPLLLELVFQLRAIEEVWEPRISSAPYFYSVGDLYDLEANLSASEKKDATAAAMETYGPIIRNMIEIAGLAASIVLLN